MGKNGGTAGTASGIGTAASGAESKSVGAAVMGIVNAWQVLVEKRGAVARVFEGAVCVFFLFFFALR